MTRLFVERPMALPGYAKKVPFYGAGRVKINIKCTILGGKGIQEPLCPVATEPHERDCSAWLAGWLGIVVPLLGVTRNYHVYHVYYQEVTLQEQGTNHKLSNTIHVCPT